MLAKSRATADAARDLSGRVPRRPRRAAPRRGRMGRRRDLQWRDQPVRRQAGRVRRDRGGCCGPAGCLQFADIANGHPVPPEAMPRSICGPVELPVACPVQAGSRCSPMSGFTNVTDRPPARHLRRRPRRTQRPHLRRQRLRIPRPQATAPRLIGPTPHAWSGSSSSRPGAVIEHGPQCPRSPARGHRSRRQPTAPRGGRQGSQWLPVPAPCRTRRGFA